MFNSIFFKTPILNWKNGIINCTDNDGDGFYYWGIGERPDKIPSWIPLTPDGDDSDAIKGYMDDYGNCVELPNNLSLPPILLTQDEKWEVPLVIGQSIEVEGATLTICANTTFIDGKEIILHSGATLIIDGCAFAASINALPGSTIIVKNDGSIKSPADKSFNVPLGVSFELYSGTIE